MEPLDRDTFHFKRGNKLTALSFYAGMLAANHFFRDPLVVKANDPVKRKLLRAFPSALISPEATGNRVLDSLTTVGMAALSIETARRVRNSKEMAMTAIVAHGLATAANVAVDHLGLLNEEEREQEDVGFSTVAIAIGIDYMLHRADHAKSKKGRTAWRSAVTVLAGGSVVGSYAAKDKLAASAHVAGALVGGAAYLANRSK
jgi:hypothetical protein